MKTTIPLTTRTFPNSAVPCLAFQIGTVATEPYSFIQTWKGQPVPIHGSGEVFTIVAFGRTPTLAAQMAKARGHIGQVTWL